MSNKSLLAETFFFFIFLALCLYQIIEYLVTSGKMGIEQVMVISDTAEMIILD
jgi:hypothetical protein